MFRKTRENGVKNGRTLRMPGARHRSMCVLAWEQMHAHHPYAHLCPAIASSSFQARLYNKLKAQKF